MDPLGLVFVLFDVVVLVVIFAFVELVIRSVKLQHRLLSGRGERI